MNKVNIYGGLGNQMFQYAFVNMLISKGIPARISMRDFFLYNHHNGFELTHAFDINLSFSDRIKLKLLVSGSSLWSYSVVKKVLAILFSSYSRLFENSFKEKKEFCYDADVLKASNSRFIGTWQSVKYLPKEEYLLKDVFKFRVPTDTRNVKLSSEIRENNSVAVHIRRGDYTSQEWRNTHLVIDGSAYYQTAIEELSSKFKDLTFYFFSDDMPWVMANFKAPNFKYIDHNSGLSSYIDMYLMSLCSKFIIPNSTFSWWAAWLSGNTEKVVYMPSPWIKGLTGTEIYPANCIVKNV
ncbi:hypothetical protein J2X69_004135 [Algoriphagus sp. 4150]|uniref:alpha-1,2-fucosyltransferase n=1 Tax=Algoriphagus sp. 4150 TaxID=2817756 RepID=UPI00285A172A|nr:alpha-1,2-fucosyltransferase [Algoriphagus sp. 4150]MDR7131770.1 hypothetical protein [Algoriphagus sp. 4150]